MTTIAPLRPRLAQLVRLLASDKDGEVLGAARAIGRTLQANGLDLHDLAAIVERADEASTPRLPPASEDWPAIAEWCARYGGVLAPRDRQFLASIRGHLARGIWPTAAQAKWLADIRGKVMRAAA